jgi:hypothetical protein
VIQNTNFELTVFAVSMNFNEAAQITCSSRDDVTSLALNKSREWIYDKFDGVRKMDTLKGTGSGEERGRGVRGDQGGLEARGVGAEGPRVRGKPLVTNGSCFESEFWKTRGLLEDIFLLFGDLWRR